MRFINQNDYPHIPYYHNTDKGGPPEDRTSVKTSGCGLCAGIMMLDALTPFSLSVEEMVKLSESTGANHSLGTDMKILGKVLSKKFNLNFNKTNSVKKAISTLRNGGHVIALVTVPKDKEIGLFTKRSHYINLLSTDGKKFCILDPSYTTQKFHIPEREGLVDESRYPFLYADVSLVDSEAKKVSYSYYLFSRK